MQIVYATHLPLPSENDASALDLAAEAVASWVRKRFNVEMSPLAAGHGESDSARVEWKSMTGSAGGLIGVFVDQADRGDPTWRWRTYVDLGVEDGQAWLRVRVGLYSPLEGLLTKPRVHAGRPGVVRALADRLTIRADGWRVGEWRTVGRSQVGAYLEFLRSAHRQLPVVVLSTDNAGDTFLDPARVADRVLGLAHVVKIDTAAAYLVSDRIGKTLSCYLGAVRIYWPGFRSDDDPYHHRLFLEGSLNYLGREGLEAELFDILGRLAGLSLDEPPLRRALRIEERAAEVAARIAEQTDHAARLVATADMNDGGLSAEEFVEFAAEFDQMTAQVKSLELSSLDAESEIASLRAERDESRSQLIEVVRQYGDPRREQPTALVDLAPPTSVAEAVRRADDAAEHSVYLREAFDSAEQSGYQDPSRVMDDLRVIEEIATDWAAGDLSAGPNHAFEQRCSNYQSGLGQKASTQYAVDYERVYKDQVVMLGPHLRRGIGAVASILRIYMYFDTDDQRIVVGHVGRKLRDDSNRN